MCGGGSRVALRRTLDLQPSAKLPDPSRSSCGSGSRRQVWLGGFVPVGLCYKSAYQWNVQDVVTMNASLKCTGR